MKTLLNRKRFLKVAQYTNEHYFSKPYSLSPIVDRWFNQLAMIEFEGKSEPIHLSLSAHANLASFPVDIVLDGEVIPKDKIALILKFHSQKSTHDEERKALVLRNDEQALEVFDREKAEAKALYERITTLLAEPTAEPRVKSVINIAALEQKYNAKVKNIVHRPNHGLTHSVRAAYYVTAIHAYRKEHNKHSLVLNELDLEKLQMMMCFSVVGRKDETGFSDTGDNVTGNATYSSFRSASGRAYLSYFSSKEGEPLYGTDLDKVYRDAIIVELMGFSSIQDAISRNKTPEMLLNYAIMKEGKAGRLIEREDAIRLVSRGVYTLKTLFINPSVELDKANAKLKMMNEAHALDLIRCYSLYPTSDTGPKSIATLNYHLWQSSFFDFTDKPNGEQLESFYQLMRTSFDTLKVTGQRSTFGLLSRAEFALRKDDLLNAVKAIHDRFKDSANRDELLKKAREAHVANNTQEYFTSQYVGDPQSSAKDDLLLKDYRNYLIVRAVADKLSAISKLASDKCMFNFQHPDHHQSALSLIRALENVKPYKGLETTQPMLRAVKHQREQNKTTVLFDEEDQAQEFQELYNDLFGFKPEIIKKDASYSIEVNRAQYLQMRDKQLIQFKLVTVPKKVERETSLIDELGQVDALSLVAHNRALVRLVSTTALQGEDFPDYDYLLRSFEDPINERYTPDFKEMDKFPVDHGRYYDPRNGKSYTRAIVGAPCDIRFQEPVTEPISFEDKKADGLLARSEGRGAAKNTIYTKKLPHSLLPSHGKVIPFSGHAKIMRFYFPIGVLSDIEQVDLKSERYIWTENMVTNKKFWIRDPSVLRRQIYKELDAQLENGGLVRHSDGVAKLNKGAVPNPTSKANLVKDLARKAESFRKLLEERYYRPSDDDLVDFSKLIAQQKSEYLNQVRTDPKSQEYSKEIIAIFDTMKNRIKLEGERKSFKYAMTLRELIKYQENTPKLSTHNEILAANTKGATRAFYATQDTLFDRLNVAFHGMQIKKKYGYDVPLLVMSQDKPPYNYSEQIIMNDLREAYKLLREGKFPYDMTICTLYEVDDKGKLRLENGSPVARREDGKRVQTTKDLGMQQSMLVDFFKIGLKELKTIDELTQGRIDNKEIELESAINIIMKEMNFIGGLERENTLMERVFRTDDVNAREKSFLRACSLGHQSLVEKILSRKDFKITLSLFEKGLQFAEKNKHTELVKCLEKNQAQLIERQKALAAFVTAMQDKRTEPIAIEARVNKYLVMLQWYNELPDKSDYANEKEQLDLFAPVLLNDASLHENLGKVAQRNKGAVSDLIQFLIANPEFKTQYMAYRKSEIPVDWESLLAVFPFPRQFATPDAKKLFMNALELNLVQGKNTASIYLGLIRGRHPEADSYFQKMSESGHAIAKVVKGGVTLEKLKTYETKELERYLDDGKELKSLTSLLQKEIDDLGYRNKFAELTKLVGELEALSRENPKDSKLKEFCNEMRDNLKQEEDSYSKTLNYDYLFLIRAQRITEAVYNAVNSDEVKAINAAINRLEHRAKHEWGGIGNQRKADKIRAALYDVELMDRLNVFTNPSKLASCDKVKQEISEHRLLPNFFSSDKRARSLIEVTSDIEQRKQVKA